MNSGIRANRGTPPRGENLVSLFFISARSSEWRREWTSEWTSSCHEKQRHEVFAPWRSSELCRGGQTCMRGRNRKRIFKLPPCSLLSLSSLWLRIGPYELHLREGCFDCVGVNEVFAPWRSSELCRGGQTCMRGRNRKRIFNPHAIHLNALNTTILYLNMLPPCSLLSLSSLWLRIGP
jgi:hypothetical protein